MVLVLLADPALQVHQVQLVLQAQVDHKVHKVLKDQLVLQVQ